MILTFMALQLYIVDAYEFAASALAATSLLRSLFGFAFPLFAQRLFAALGVGGGNSLLGGFAILLGETRSLVAMLGERRLNIFMLQVYHSRSTSGTVGIACAPRTHWR